MAKTLKQMTIAYGMLKKENEQLKKQLEIKNKELELFRNAYLNSQTIRKP